MEISVISPVYRAENIVHELCNRVIQHTSAVTNDFEIILVEDFSPDNSWKKIEECCAVHSQVKGIKLSRNFGQHNAITAGLQACTGKWIIIMDCDLQDDPEVIPALYSKAKQGFEIVLVRRVNRQDNAQKKLSSRLFYKVYSYFTNTVQDPSVANYGIYHQNVITAINSMGDMERVFPTLLQWVGYNKSYLDVQHNSRFEGKSSYTFRKLFALAFRMIVSFSDKPLKMALVFGSLISVASFLVGFIYFVLTLMGKITQPGFASLIISIWFLGGTILLSIGVLGLYISKIFDKVKGRPNYIIQKTINLHDQ